MWSFNSEICAYSDKNSNLILASWNLYTAFSLTFLLTNYSTLSEFHPNK